MVVDALMQKFYNKPFDTNGKIATSGMMVLELFAWMKRHPFLKRKPPKSTGREEFGREFIQELLKRSRHYDKKDIIATASQFTAFSIFDSYTRFVEKEVDELIISGGGAKNRFFVEALRGYFRNSSVRFSDEFGVPSEAKEAMCFAILANETLSGIPTNLPSVTGARKMVVLGKICTANEIRATH